MWNWIKKYRVEVILGCLLIYIAFLLFYNLWVQSFWIDEGFSSYVAKKMSLEGFYKSSYFLYEWLQALTFKIAWISDFTARFPSAILQLWSVFLMYLIPYKLTKNKYVGLISSAVFWFLYWELAWWRDARFYSLLQLIFLWGITSLVYWTEDKKTVYLNIAILLAWIGSIFHPFLYMLWVMSIVVFLLQYKKLWDFKSLFSKKYLSTWILIVLALVWALVYVIGSWKLWELISNNTSTKFTWEMRMAYLKFYNLHLREQLWLLFPLWILWMLWTAFKKRFKETTLFLLPFLFFEYVLVFQGKMLHYRYALLIYPLMVLSVIILSYRIFSTSKYKWLILSFIIVCIIGSLYTTKYQFIPRTYYAFDFTSPQPDFKSAYAKIPDWRNVISWFPVLCDRYYSDRGTCTHAIRVDMVHDGQVKALLNYTNESYTKVPYVDDLSELDSWIYYVVIDNLTKNSNTINEHLYLQIAQYWKKVFDSWVDYNKIVVAALWVE